MIFSGLFSAVFSISVPPSEEIIKDGPSTSGSMIIDKYNSFFILVNSVTNNFSTITPSESVCSVTIFLPRIPFAKVLASSGELHNFTPPAFPLPPECI